MRDTELYRAILGLTPPWTVGSVDAGHAGGQVVVWVDAGRRRPFAVPGVPGRGALTTSAAAVAAPRHLPVHDLDRGGRAPVECATHGVKQIRVPWAEPGSQFTALFERLAIDLLRECSVTGAKRVLRISWDEAWGIKTPRGAPGAGPAPGGGRAASRRGREGHRQAAPVPHRRRRSRARTGCSTSPTTASRRAWTASGPP